ncbi:hypothetical protein RHSIM_Rhsim01G0034700 [Rhododendron simsii]|uniref:Uncharacterized protein n=1 Tax=Rhododendron simsii TaxID=118357 RepID=A0A834HQ48_RHOSS|nr:hypothetical protein RHSIM_Rhsim01G0034700 [Rhododendron simsii]
MERSLPSLATEIGCRARGGCLRTRCFLQLQMRMGPWSDVGTAKSELVRDPSRCHQSIYFALTLGGITSTVLPHGVNILLRVYFADKFAWELSNNILLRLVANEQLS